MGIGTSDRDRLDRQEAESLALGALAWVLSDANRAQRLLDLTGMEPDQLRHRISERTVQAEIIQFLANHEADLIGAAQALDIEPQELLNAKETLLR